MAKIFDVSVLFNFDIQHSRGEVYFMVPFRVEMKLVQWYLHGLTIQISKYSKWSDLHIHILLLLQWRFKMQQTND